jgi:hypothetical protein
LVVEEPPSVRSPEMIARKTKTPVLHNRYMWSRVRRNISVMLGRCGICQRCAPLVRSEIRWPNLNTRDERDPLVPRSPHPRPFSPG